MTAGIDTSTGIAVRLVWPDNKPPAELPEKLRWGVLHSSNLGFTLEGMTVREVVNRLNALYKEHGYRISSFPRIGRHFVTGNRWRRMMRPGDILFVRVHRFYSPVGSEPVAQGTVVYGDPERRARSQTITEKHQRLLKP